MKKYYVAVRILGNLETREIFEFDKKIDANNFIIDIKKLYKGTVEIIRSVKE